jgi:hypothetical protein
MALGRNSAKVCQGSFGNCLAIAVAERSLAKWQGSANNTSFTPRWFESAFAFGRGFQDWQILVYILLARRAVLAPFNNVLLNFFSVI